MAKRIGPEARIIALFTALPEDSRRIVLDIIKAQTARPKGSTAAPSAGRKSPRKNVEPLLPVNTVGETERASSAAICGICGNVEDHSDHFESSAIYHVFVSSKKAKSAA